MPEQRKDTDPQRAAKTKYGYDTEYNLFTNLNREPFLNCRPFLWLLQSSPKMDALGIDAYIVHDKNVAGHRQRIPIQIKGSPNPLDNENDGKRKRKKIVFAESNTWLYVPTVYLKDKSKEGECYEKICDVLERTIFHQYDWEPDLRAIYYAEYDWTAARIKDVIENRGKYHPPGPAMNIARSGIGPPFRVT